jgi:hypothetical protein
MVDRWLAGASITSLAQGREHTKGVIRRAINSATSAGQREEREQRLKQEQVRLREMNQQERAERREARQQIDLAARDQVIVARYLGGATMVGLAQEFGISRQRVGAILTDLVTDEEREERDRRVHEAREAVRPKSKPLVEVDYSRECLICGAPVQANRRRTCSPEHAREWRRMRYAIDPEERAKQRIIQARSTLRKPETYPAPKVAWARRVLGIPDE